MTPTHPASPAPQHPDLIKSLTGTYEMCIKEGRLVITTDKVKYRNFKAVFSIPDVQELVRSRALPAPASIPASQQETQYSECHNCKFVSCKLEITGDVSFEPMGCPRNISIPKWVVLPRSTMDCPICHNSKNIIVYGRSKRLYDWETCKGCRFKKICEMPYLPPCGAYHDIDQMKEHDATISRAAADAVIVEAITELQKWHDEIYGYDSGNIRMSTLTEAIYFLDSLRRHAPQQEHPQ